MLQRLFSTKLHIPVACCNDCHAISCSPAPVQKPRSVSRIFIFILFVFVVVVGSSAPWMHARLVSALAWNSPYHCMLYMMAGHRHTPFMCSPRTHECIDEQDLVTQSSGNPLHACRSDRSMCTVPVPCPFMSRPLGITIEQRPWLHLSLPAF